MRSFDGQVVDGSIFGVSDQVTLPKFDQVNEYLSPDGQVQLDAWAGLAAIKWIVEVKWRTKRVCKKKWKGCWPMPGLSRRRVVHFSRRIYR